jgi:hypothetical protein
MRNRSWDSELGLRLLAPSPPVRCGVNMGRAVFYEQLCHTICVVIKERQCNSYACTHLLGAIDRGSWTYANHSIDYSFIRTNNHYPDNNRPPAVMVQLSAIAVSPLQGAFHKTSHHQIDDQSITSSVLQQKSSTKPYTEGETDQSRCATARTGEAAIASNCRSCRSSVENRYSIFLSQPVLDDRASISPAKKLSITFPVPIRRGHVTTAMIGAL